MNGKVTGLSNRHEDCAEPQKFLSIMKNVYPIYPTIRISSQQNLLRTQGIP